MSASPHKFRISSDMAASDGDSGDAGARDTALQGASTRPRRQAANPATEVAVRGVRYLALRSSRRICSSASITSSRVTRLRAKLSFRLNSFVGGRNANT